MKRAIRGIGSISLSKNKAHRNTVVSGHDHRRNCALLPLSFRLFLACAAIVLLVRCGRPSDARAIEQRVGRGRRAHRSEGPIARKVILTRWARGGADTVLHRRHRVAARVRPVVVRLYACRYQAGNRRRELYVGFVGGVEFRTPVHRGRIGGWGRLWGSYVGYRGPFSAADIGQGSRRLLSATTAPHRDDNGQSERPQSNDSWRGPRGLQVRGSEPFTVPGATGHGHPAVSNPRRSRPTERCILAIPMAAIVMPKRASVTTGGRVLGMRMRTFAEATPVPRERLARKASDT